MAPNLDHDLHALARKLVREGPHKTLPTPRRIRIVQNGRYVADTTRALCLWEHPYYPQYYIPTEDFVEDAFNVVESVYSEEGEIVASLSSFRNCPGTPVNIVAVSFKDDLTGAAAMLSGRTKVIFSKADGWFEEDTPIHVHPKDPFKRVDIVQSTRPLKVRIDGTIVAESRTSMHLYETGLATRYYIPLTSVNQSLLRRSELRTQCPYKGEAEYYHVVLGDGEDVRENVVWYYTRPTVECAAIQGLVCFYNEKVEIVLDND